MTTRVNAEYGDNTALSPKDVVLDLPVLRAIAKRATKGPWFLGDRWHVQGAGECECRPEYGPLIIEKRMSINGQMMAAHVHERPEPWYEHGIFTAPDRSGHPGLVVYTTDEYGHPARRDEEYIAAFNPHVTLALLEEITALRKQVATAANPKARTRVKTERLSWHVRNIAKSEGLTQPEANVLQTAADEIDRLQKAAARNEAR